MNEDNELMVTGECPYCRRAKKMARKYWRGGTEAEHALTCSGCGAVSNEIGWKIVRTEIYRPA